MAFPWAYLILIVFLSFTETHAQGTQTFIVRVDNDLKPSQFSSVEDWYSSTLKSLSSNNVDTLSSRNPSVAFLHIYKTVFHGFSAKLTPQQAQELKAMHGVLSVIPDRIRQTQTTRSPHFLGLYGNAKANMNGQLMNISDYGSNVIIGLLDTGIWPERRSFHDENLGPVPSRWKGECVGGDDFPKTLCNKKLIGVRYFNNGYQATATAAEQNIVHSARDTVGHGTLTASIAAGRAVSNASFFGLASGEAAGIAQKARIAMYKVCWENGCADSDVLAGFESAVDDGVDVVSISLSYKEALRYEVDPIAVASFGAMERGIFVSAAAGNGGSTDLIMSVANVAPWITTVGASSIDRNFPVDLHLDDGTIITGSSLYVGDELANTSWPLIYAGNASVSPFFNSCFVDSLRPELVRGKIVVCESVDYPVSMDGVVLDVPKQVVVKEAGGVGMVVANVALSRGSPVDVYMLPSLAVTESATTKLLAYITSNPNPTARMAFRGTQIGVKPAPVVASFSSRGPNPISNHVMKPDLIAPGVNILAAYLDGIPPSDLRRDPRRTEFILQSGTSMACPHVSGIAALLKGARPEWSPAMIRSALMTTAYTRDQDGNELHDEMMDMKFSIPWARGAGHVDPEKALDPGLVYDLTVEDYIDFLCVSNLGLAEIKALTRRAVVNCSQAQNFNPWDLNYPAISLAFDTSGPYDAEVVVKRTVTNVGDNTPSNYTVTVTMPREVMNITVDPQTLVFNQKGEKKSYTIRIGAQHRMLEPKSVQGLFGEMSWSDGKHQVTSPIIVYWFRPSF